MTNSAAMGSDAVNNGTVNGASLPDQVVNAALNYQVAQPLVKAIMADAGLGNGSLTGIAQTLADMAVPVVESAATAITSKPSVSAAITSHSS